MGLGVINGNPSLRLKCLSTDRKIKTNFCCELYSLILIPKVGISVPLGKTNCIVVYSLIGAILGKVDFHHFHWALRKLHLGSKYFMHYCSCIARQVSKVISCLVCCGTENTSHKALTIDYLRL